MNQKQIELLVTALLYATACIGEGNWQAFLRGGEPGLI